MRPAVFGDGPLSRAAAASEATPPATAYGEELAVARDLAVRAGHAVLRLYGSTASRRKSGGSPVTAADLEANRIILEGLRDRFPGDAILSEESADPAGRVDARRVWIIDPLDGTKEYLKQNGEFAVMIGLVVDGEPVVAAVYQPDGDALYSAEIGQGARVRRAGEERPLRREPGDTPDPLRFVHSRSHGDPLLGRIKLALGIQQARQAGSVGIKCALIAEGQSDLYIHPVRYLREWDTCAPELVLREAGGAVADCFGRPLTYNKPEPVQTGGIVAAAPGVLAGVLEVVAPMMREEWGEG